jgi:hypothetical protein
MTVLATYRSGVREHCARYLGENGCVGRAGVGRYGGSAADALVADARASDARWVVICIDRWQRPRDPADLFRANGAQLRAPRPLSGACQ